MNRTHALAHPMLQPTDWSRPPDALRGSMPEARRRLYEIIWNCTLACAYKPPVLLHRRVVYTTKEGQVVAFASVTPGERQGYWRFRQDYPAQAFPVTEALPIEASLTVTRSIAHPDPAVSGMRLSALLAHMERLRLATPAAAAPLLHDLIEGANPALDLSTTDGLRVTLTRQATRWLAQWREAGLVGLAEAQHATVDAVADGTLGYRDAVRALFGPATARADQAIRQIDALCAHWKGLSRLASLAAARGEAAGVPHHEGLPAWIDPEAQLAADHPWRALREAMERTLAAEHRDWLAIGDEARAALRLAWLLDRADLDPDLVAHLRAPDGRFDAVRYWMTGAKT